MEHIFSPLSKSEKLIDGDACVLFRANDSAWFLWTKTDDAEPWFFSCLALFDILRSL